MLETEDTSGVRSDKLPKTRELWRKLRLKLKLAETVGLLKNEAVMGYSDSVRVASNGTDGTSTAEKRKQEARLRQQCCIVMPNSFFRVVWDLLSAGFLIYLLIVLPVVIGMDLREWKLFTLDSSKDAAMFCFDFGSSSCTGSFDY